MAEEGTIEIFRGEAATFNFTHTGLNITTFSTPIRFTVAKAANSTTKLITKNAATIDATHYRVTVEEEDTDLKPGTYFFDCWRMDEGEEEVLAYGPCTIRGDARVPPIEP